MNVKWISGKVIIVVISIVILSTPHLQQQQQEPKEGKLQEGKDGIMEMQMWLTNGTYTLTQVLGCNWTLYCAPKGLLNTTIFPSLGKSF